MARNKTGGFHIELAESALGVPLVRVRFDYSESMVASIKALGGWRWNPQDKAWVLTGLTARGGESFEDQVNQIFSGTHKVIGVAKTHGLTAHYAPLPPEPMPPQGLGGAHVTGGEMLLAYAAAVSGLARQFNASTDEIKATPRAYRPAEGDDVPIPPTARAKTGADPDVIQSLGQYSDGFEVPPGFSQLLVTRSDPRVNDITGVRYSMPANTLAYSGSGADLGAGDIQNWTLFRHQVEAVYRFRTAIQTLKPRAGASPTGRRLLIAHEMGLGKTLTGVAIANVYHGPFGYRIAATGADVAAPPVGPWYTPQRGRVVVVCPEHLRLAWAQAFRSTGRPALIYGIDKTPGKRWAATEWGVLIIGAASIAKETMDKLGVNDLAYDLLILDEAHYFKNKDAQRTQAVLKQQERVDDVVLLTGTPQLKAPVDLYVPMFIAAPTKYENFYAFAAKYCNARKTKFGWDFSGASNIDDLHEQLKSVMHRKLKSAADLPEKTRAVVPLVVPDEVREETIQRLRDAAKLVDNGKRPNAVKGAISTLRSELWPHKEEPCLQWMRSFLDGNPGEKLVVMTWHVETCKKIAGALRSHLNARGEGVAEFHGETSTANKEAAVKNFQGAMDTRVIVGTISAMGTGVTLTAASNLAFAEIDWTPGIMLQAEDRIHRISQKNKCTVWYLVAGGTVEEIQVRSLCRKLGTASAAVDGGGGSNFDELQAWLEGAEDAGIVPKGAANSLEVRNAYDMDAMRPPQVSFVSVTSTLDSLLADYTDAAAALFGKQMEAEIRKQMERYDFRGTAVSPFALRNDVT